MPAGVFVGFEAGPGKGAKPPVGGVLHRIRCDPVEHGIGDADLREHRFAAVAAPRQQQVSRLLAKKGDRHGSARRDPSNFAARPVDAARDVDRDDRQPPLTGRLDDRARHPLDRPGETRAKNAVENERGAVEHRRLQCLDSTRPARRGLRSVAAQCRDGAEQRQAHRPAALGQQARRDKPVPAIVPRAAEDRQRLRRPPPRNRVGNLAAGVFHQLDAGYAIGDRQPIRLAHLGRGQQSVPAPALGGNRHRRDVGVTPCRRKPGLTHRRRIVTSSTDGGCSSAG